MSNESRKYIPITCSIQKRHRIGAYGHLSLGSRDVFETSIEKYRRLRDEGKIRFGENSPQHEILGGIVEFMEDYEKRGKVGSIKRKND